MNLQSLGDPRIRLPSAISVRCPHCQHVGTFQGISHDGNVVHDVTLSIKTAGEVREDLTAGLRRCPNLSCRALLFFAKRGRQQFTYPTETIDFDATKLPPDILSTLEESIKCHAAGCYRAAALMIRRTLEELCDDKAAGGNSLKARIAALNSVAVIPGELLAAADELRILGNDAAHIEAKEYDKIGKEEAEVGIELAKELLKAVYQYSSLVDRLRALKKPTS